jgi:16S rRNA (cytosine967-C5)-methyltransferase
VTIAAAKKKPAARELALAVVRDVFGPEARGAQASFDAHVRRTDLDARDRAFAAELAYGAVKWRRLLDWYLAPYLADRAKKLPEAIGEILRLGAYQIRLMDGVDAHAAVFETVNLALRHGHRGTAGLVNAILRRLIADAPPEPLRADFEHSDDYLGTAHSLPAWLAVHLAQTFGEQLDAVLTGVNGAPQRALRVNRLRATHGEVAAELASGGALLQPSDLVAETLILTGGYASDDPDGRWSLQGESACVPVDLLDPQPGESVVELCSGRGNKSVQIAARMSNAGTLTCVEIEPRKLRVLRENLERCGVTCASVVGADARTVELAAVDAVLLDAPCSAIGLIGRHPEARWRKSPDDGARLGPLQSELLAAAADRVKPAGRLVYSVCSTDPREGREVVRAFLDANPAFGRAEHSARYRPFETADGDLLIPPGVAGRDGFFVARLKRVA